MALHRCTSSPLLNNNDGSHANNIFDKRPVKVDWSNLCDFGSNVGTNDAVAFSARAAPELTVPMARVIAINVVPMGTLSDEDDDDVSAEAASLVAAGGFMEVLAFALEGATLDLQR